MATVDPSIKFTMACAMDDSRFPIQPLDVIDLPYVTICVTVC